MLTFKISNITVIGVICKLFSAEPPLFLHKFHVIKNVLFPIWVANQ